MKLKKINLNKGYRHIKGKFDESHYHPDIKVDKWYLAKCGGRYAAGQFSMQWYGLNFNGFYDAGLQFDRPHTNRSSWQALWEIIP